jgi:hypothetical protein
MEDFRKSAIIWSQEMIDAVKWVNHQFEGQLMFGGSFSLVLNGKLRRYIGDIDIITFENHYGNQK